MKLWLNLLSKTGTALPAGTAAPDFSLHSTPDQTVKLSEFRGDRSCSRFIRQTGVRSAATRWRSTTNYFPNFKTFDAELLGISVDGGWCHAAFSQNRKLHFPLLADFEPKGAVARLYGVYRESDGTSERALFVIDADGVIRWSYVSPVGVNPGADGILSALEELQNKPEAK